MPFWMVRTSISVRSTMLLFLIAYPCFSILVLPPKLTCWTFGLPWELEYLAGPSLHAGAEWAVIGLNLGTSELMQLDANILEDGNIKAWPSFQKGQGNRLWGNFLGWRGWHFFPFIDFSWWRHTTASPTLQRKPNADKSTLPYEECGVVFLAV